MIPIPCVEAALPNMLDGVLYHARLWMAVSPVFLKIYQQRTRQNASPNVFFRENDRGQGHFRTRSRPSFARRL